MDNMDQHGFSSDRPICGKNDDLLGRANFSKSLGDALVGWHGDDSLVVSLNGEWGDGKTSIKNMVVEEMKSRLENRPQIIEFSPWDWAGQDRISSSFFDEISTAVNRTDKSKSGRLLAKALRKYGSYLNTGRLISVGLSRIFSYILFIFVFLGLGGLAVEKNWVVVLIFSAIFVLAAIMKWGRSLLTSLAEGIEWSAEADDKTLIELKQELRLLLSKKCGPLLIIMDDLDRLTTTQARMVFQLVKANSDFPNLVFLLLFQRNIVEAKFDDGLQSGAEYLEKIIQVPFDIPKVEISSIHQVLFRNLDRIIESHESIAEKWEQVYWGNLFHESLHVFFKNLRDIYRFSSTLSFHFALMKSRRAFELNPVDLIGIECLRVFEPSVYKEISSLKSVMTTNGPERHGRKEDEVRSALDSVIDKSTSDKREHVMNMIKLLFPTTSWALGGDSYDHSFLDEWGSKLRVCHSSHFDKYFQFSIPQGELSQSDLKDMLDATSDENSFSMYLERLQSRGILKTALSQLLPLTEGVSLENAEPIIKVLINIGDEVESSNLSLTDFSTYHYITWIVDKLLSRIEDPKNRGDLLTKCLYETQGLSVIERILLVESQRREKDPNEGQLKNEAFEELKCIFVKRLDDLAESDPLKLLNNQHFASLLYRWVDWGDKGKICKWLEKQVKTEEGLFAFLKAFILQGTSQGMEDYVPRITKKINLTDIENFISVSLIKSQIQELDESGLDKGIVETIEVFRKAVELSKAGKNFDR